MPAVSQQPFDAPGQFSDTGHLFRADDGNCQGGLQRLPRIKRAGGFTICWHRLRTALKERRKKTAGTASAGPRSVVERNRACGCRLATCKPAAGGGDSGGIKPEVSQQFTPVAVFNESVGNAKPGDWPTCQTAVVDRL